MFRDKYLDTEHKVISNNLCEDKFQILMKFFQII